MLLPDECLDSLGADVGAQSRHVRRTLGEEARTRFLRDGYVFGWLRGGSGRALGATQDVSVTYQYRYVCGECREWWGLGLSPELYHDAGARAEFEARSADAFGRECRHQAARLARTERMRRDAHGPDRGAAGAND